MERNLPTIGLVCTQAYTSLRLSSAFHLLAWSKMRARDVGRVCVWGGGVAGQKNSNLSRYISGFISAQQLWISLYGAHKVSVSTLSSTAAVTTETNASIPESLHTDDSNGGGTHAPGCLGRPSARWRWDPGAAASRLRHGTALTPARTEPEHKWTAGQRYRATMHLAGCWNGPPLCHRCF